MKRAFCIVMLAATAALGFDIARPGYDYQFPRDHFSHPNFETEWWYYTGNLHTRQGRRFGFELTFFRYAIREDADGDSPWNIRDLYLAHLTLSDIEGQRFYKTDRLNRAGPGPRQAPTPEKPLSGTATGGFNGSTLPRPRAPQRLTAYADEFSLELDLSPLKPPVFHGVNGISQKAAGEGKASHYISFTRLAVSGSLALQSETSKSRVSPGWTTSSPPTVSAPTKSVGDWMSIQLDDDSEFMLYRMRRSDGTADPHSSGTYIDAAGRARHLAWSQIQMTPVADSDWKSPTTGGVYPLMWKVEIPHLDLRLTGTTDLDDQEVVSERRVGPSYWEGAMNFSGQKAGKPVAGVGYLEMTGYDKPLQLGPQDPKRVPLPLRSAAFCYRGSIIPPCLSSSVPSGGYSVDQFSKYLYPVPVL